MTDPGFLGKTRKLFSSTDKSKTSGGKPNHDAIRQRGTSRALLGTQGRSMNPVPSNTPEIWPYQMTMFGLPSLPRSAPKPRSKSRSIGHPAALHTSISVPATASSNLPTSPPSGSNDHSQPRIVELEAQAPGASLPISGRHAPSSKPPNELPVAKTELAELEAPLPSLARSRPSESSQDCRIATVGPEVPELPADPVSTTVSEPLELCSHQGVADQPSNGVHNILKDIRVPVESTRGGYVYFSADADARGLLKLGYTETWDEPWVIGIPENVVFRPSLTQSNSLGKRIRQRKSTCGLWPVVKLVAPMKHAGRRMKMLVRSTLVDNMKESSDGSDPELFDCTLLQAEQVLRLWQRFSNLQPFTSSGELDASWGKYVKDGLRGRWNIYLIEKWTSTSLERMLGKMERRRANMYSEIRESFQPDQWSALQIIIRAMEEKGEESGNDEAWRCKIHV